MARKRILVIEDEYLIAVELEDLLDEFGFDVGHAATEAEALARIAEGGWDGAVADANLHGRDITAVAAALRARGIPFVIASGYGRESLPPGLADVPLLVKPFDSMRLVHVVSRFGER